MLRMIRNGLGAITLLALAGCQTSGLSAGGVAQLQSAGYTAVPGTPSSVGEFSNVAAYICPEDRCSSRQVVTVVQLQGTVDAQGRNFEQQLRDTRFTQAQKTAVFQRAFNVADKTRRITSTRLFSQLDQIGVDFEGFGKTPAGANVRFVGRFFARGNTGTAVVAISANGADARRALRLALSN
jgi:hypothetical protein